MNKERVEKYISVWLKNINKEGLAELENDIKMPLKTFMIEILNNLYEKYRDEISHIPVNLDRYEDYIIAPRMKMYSLENFLLNRLLRNVTSIIYRDESNSFMPESHYSHEFGEVLIDKNRIQTQIPDIRQRKKIIAHEFLHGMKTQFFTGDFLEADTYYQTKEDLKGIFSYEINDFERKNSEVNSAYKHCGMSYSSRYFKQNYGIQNNIDATNLDEILNEDDAIACTKDDHKVIAELAENRYMILSNPESSNTYITNYSFIIENLVNKKILFTGLYLEPATFYKEFNALYTPIFQKHFNSNLSAIEILTNQLDKIKRAPKNIDEHVKLLNTLYDCLNKKYMMSEYGEQKRINDIKQITGRGILEIVNEHLHPLDSLDYAKEYNDNQKKIK